MDYSSALAMRARSWGQRLGVLRPMVRVYRRLLAKSYEQRFHDALLDAIRPGDTVWDVGANVGVYTALFADRVGVSGKVVAFEPSPGPFAALAAATGGRPNVQLHNVALSRESGRLPFFIDETGLGTTDGLGQLAGPSQAIEVRVERGDAFRAAGLPDVIKIDVEGFELEVLTGLSGVLADARLRAVFVEVHFLTLAKRGLDDAPAEMLALLRAEGLGVRWIDPSHFAATRTG